MKIQLQQILRALPLLRAWLGGGSDAPRFRPSLAYKLNLLAKELDEHLVAYQDAVRQVLRQNAVQVTEDGFSFVREDGTADQEAVARAEQALRELAETEVELHHAVRLTLQDLEDTGVRLSVPELDSISWLLEVQDESEPAS